MSRTRRQRLLSRQLRQLTARGPDAGLLRSHPWAQVPLASLPWLSASDLILFYVAEALGEDPDELHGSLIPGWAAIYGRPLAYSGHRAVTGSADYGESPRPHA